MRFINIGFGNVVAAQRILAVLSPDSAPIKRMIQEAKERGMLVDASFGRSTRSQWYHGGIVFAPKPRDYSYTLNKKVKRLALKSVLSAKASEENVVVIDEIKMDSIKTKTFKTFLNAVGADCKALVVTAENNEVVVKSAANIPGVQVAFANVINVYDILNAKKLVVG